jgi:hypothetical protein
MLHPEKLSARYGPSAARAPLSVLQNPSYARFLGEMARAGVTVFDAPPPLAEAPGPQFLAADTHWTPAAMERTAAVLARFVTAQGRAAARFPTRHTPGARPRSQARATSWTC